ncbi:MAG: nitrogen fixation protein NifZ [Gammaproteobacteria bacterium]
MRPRFGYGQAVRATRDLRNDGTYPGVGTGKLLAARGSIGHIRDVGVFLQDQVIYSVDFLSMGRVVGCRESELISADAPWRPARFQPGDWVSVRTRLVASGTLVAEPGTLGEIQDVVQIGQSSTLYQVAFGQRFFHVPETALEPARCTAAAIE